MLGAYRELLDLRREDFMKMITYFVLFGIIRGIKNTFFVIIKVSMVGFQNYLIIHGLSIIVTLFLIWIAKKYEGGKSLSRTVIEHDLIVFLGDVILLAALLYPALSLYLVFVSESLENMRIKSMSNAESLFFDIYNNENRSKITGIRSSIFSLGQLVGIASTFLLKESYVLIVIAIILLRPIMMWTVSRVSTTTIVTREHFTLKVARNHIGKFTILFVAYLAYVMLASGRTVYIKESVGEEYVPLAMMTGYALMVIIIPHAMKFVTSGRIPLRISAAAFSTGIILSLFINFRLLGVLAILFAFPLVNSIIFGIRHYIFKSDEGDRTGSIVYTSYMMNFVSRIPFAFLGILGLKNAHQFLSLLPLILLSIGLGIIAEKYKKINFYEHT